MIRQSSQKGRPKKSPRKLPKWRVEPVAADHFPVGKVGCQELVLLLAAAYSRIRILEEQVSGLRSIT